MRNIRLEFPPRYTRALLDSLSIAKLMMRVEVAQFSHHQQMAPHIWKNFTWHRQKTASSSRQSHAWWLFCRPLYLIWVPIGGNPIASNLEAWGGGTCLSGADSGYAKGTWTLGVGRDSRPGSSPQLPTDKAT